METTQASTDGWKDKENIIYIHICIYTHIMQYYSAMRKKEILPFATTWLGLEDITQSEVSQSEKHMHCMISLVCGI